MLPETLLEPLTVHLERVRRQYIDDLSRGLGQAPLPTALARKCPNADREWPWQWLLRHAPSRGRLRHQNGAGASRPQRRPHHDDLHPRSQPRGPGSLQPAGQDPTRSGSRTDDVLCRPGALPNAQKEGPLIDVMHLVSQSLLRQHTSPMPPASADQDRR